MLKARVLEAKAGVRMKETHKSSCGWASRAVRRVEQQGDLTSNLNANIHWGRASTAAGNDACLFSSFHPVQCWMLREVLWFIESHHPCASELADLEGKEVIAVSYFFEHF